MQQHTGGSQYGVPPPSSDMSPFSSPGGRMLGIPVQPVDPALQPQQQLAEAASPISSRPPPPVSLPRPPAVNFNELGSAIAGNFQEDEVLAAGEEVERGAASGNRWPRQETLALLKIRSEMDAAFRDATLKGPLWEDVSRKLAELGYKRSAKKCKEKFENVHKYYKRTKEGRAGRQDGKSYRFFTQLEALHSSGAAGGGDTTPSATAAPPSAAVSPTPISFSTTGMVGPLAGRLQPSPISAVAPLPMAMPSAVRLVPEVTPTTAGPQGISSSAPAAVTGISFSSNSETSASSESDDEETEEVGGNREGQKRKRGSESGSGCRSRKMMVFFEGLMKQVMEHQDAMQQRFLETLEKREQDRMIREEAWRRQEMARLNREQELLAHERAMSASRDAALISYLQKISGQSIPLPTKPAAAISVTTIPSHTPPPPTPHQPALQQQKQPSAVQPLQQQPPPPPPQHEVQHQHQSAEIVKHMASSETEMVAVSEHHEGVGSVSFEPMSSSRWPKAEVHALIQIRSGLEARYQESGPKGPLWEEISAGMQRLGYNRSAKRCKEKWENINKYFKKVKESNKKRPEDAKTCPYFHQLDALYRQKFLGSGGDSSSSAMGIQLQQEQESNPTPNIPLAADPLTTKAPSQASAQPQAEGEGKNSGNNNGNINVGNSESGAGSGSIQVKTSNGGHPPSFFDEGMKKPEDIVKELMEQRHQQAVMDNYDKLDEGDSDNMDQDDDDDDDDDEDGKMQYKIQFQRPNVSSGGGANTSTATAGSFLAIVQ